jgi:Na+/H+-dicarboxylate symporter
MRIIAVFAGKLEGEVATEGVARNGDLSNTIDLRQFFDHMPGICGQSRVKEARRQVFRVAAIALIEPDDVQAMSKGLGGQAAYVMGLAGSVEAVQGDERRTVPPFALPMTMREHARIRRDVEIADGGRRQPRKIPGIAPAEERHFVTASKRRTRNERPHRSSIITRMTKRRLYSSLYVQVLVAIAIGVIFGFVSPERAAAMRPLGDGFIKLVKMMIAPIVFSTVVVGIAHMGAMRDVGRIGFRALVYFEVVSTVALLIGLVVVTILKPGEGVGFNPATADLSSVSAYTSGAQHLSTIEFLLNVIPDTIVGAFARGEVLQVLLFSVLFGLALLGLGDRVSALVDIIAMMSDGLFAVVGLIMRLAPIGAFGAMAFTVGRYGLGSLVALGKLMAGVYITCGLFVFVVLGAIASATGFSLIKFLKYIAEEILIVLGTSSSESALPRIMAKLEHLGCAKPVVGLLVQSGWHIHLHDDGRDLRRAGQRRAPHARSGARHPRCAVADIQGCRGRDRQRFRDAGGDARRIPDDSGGGIDVIARRRSLHV